MQNLSGYEEKQLEVREKIENELKLLPPIFSEYTRFLKGQDRAETTVYTYLTKLNVCLRTICPDCYLSDNAFFQNILPSDIECYFDKKANMSTQALQLHWSCLNSFFAFLVDKNYLSTNPMQDIRRPANSSINRNLNYLTREELNRLLSSIKQDPTKFTALRDETIIMLAVSTGLDIADVVNLNIDHVDFHNGTIRVINKKGDRLISIGNSLLSLLKRWSQFRGQYFKGCDTPALFISSYRRRLSVDIVREMLRKYCERANVPQITFKDLKSTMVYLLAKENVSMESIMDFLGVSDYLMVVQAYDAAMKEYNVNIHDALNCLFDAPVLQKQGVEDDIAVQHKFSVEVKPPEYSTYTTGDTGFTIYVNITNFTDSPIKLKLKICSVYTNGMLRTSDYSYTGYQFTEEYILPETARTFGKIWITDDFPRTQLQSGEYLLLCLVEVDSDIEHYIKYVFNEGQLGNNWIEEGWYEIDPH